MVPPADGCTAVVPLAASGFTAGSNRKWKLLPVKKEEAVVKEVKGEKPEVTGGKGGKVAKKRTASRYTTQELRKKLGAKAPGSAARVELLKMFDASKLHTEACAPVPESEISPG